MNNKDFISTVSARTGLTTQEVQKAVTALVKALPDMLDDEQVLSIQGFGNFEVKKKMERVVVNPATRQRKLFPPKLALAFKPSPVLKEKFN
jgi:DNA-binding protein HU-beta